MYKRIIITVIMGVFNLQNIRAAGPLPAGPDVAATATQPPPAGPDVAATATQPPPAGPDVTASSLPKFAQGLASAIGLAAKPGSAGSGPTVPKTVPGSIAEAKHLSDALNKAQEEVKYWEGHASISLQDKAAAAKASSEEQELSDRYRKYPAKKAYEDARVRSNVKFAAGSIGAAAAVVAGGAAMLAGFALTPHTQRIKLDPSVLGQKYKVTLTFMTASLISVTGSDRTYSFTMDLTNASAIKLYDAKGAEVAQKKGDKHGELYTEQSGQTPIVVVNQGKGCLKSIAVEDVGATTPKRTSKTKSISMGENRCKSFKFILKAPDTKTITIDYDTTK